MAKLIIEGKKRLSGEVRIGGSKNSSVALIPAALLGEGPSTLDNVPLIRDVQVFAQILKDLGASVTLDRNTMTVAPNGFSSHVAPYDLVRKLRASYYLMGVLLAKFGKAEVGLPGGCDIGPRPIDQHLKGFRALGAEVTVEGGVVKLFAKKLTGAPVYLDIPSVGATINIMLAASLAEGTTVIENAAKEPHVVDLANFLNAMGGRVLGAGTDVIRIKGVKRLHGAPHSVIPDDMEAATYMMAAVATGGDVEVKGVITKHLEPVTAKLKEAGAVIEQNGDYIRVIGPERPNPVNVKTLPYPGFPTDAQQPLVAVLARSTGVSVVQESMYDNRLGYVSELIKMGAKIKVEGRTAIVEGVPRLVGAPVTTNDLRAGASLVVAGLSAEGTTEIYGLEIIDRGYELIEEKLSAIGAKVFRVEN
ncbi:MAG: UDP-N-acetylglucosamine 1-carboxyvinyltransferase [Candidatus Fermentithermobacillus carboniphilus]|uniref:UDP-N-acetylglucosamine 1-carboxyvinyltransferase n=1 Tax=Candidatus Fermentithermobacillus carboniphilus TaxID=3085328 RepID=A0AAT9LA20_9FIRM|nr:MAG: UDP-N-acetylglucosamine 1-carboxyvinyltransferase [Candidatus Fermentithermobacillus carboniphilus]